MVQRLDGCLGQVSTRTREVLVLRSGLGAADRHSRRGVARILDLRVRRVARIERRGVRRLVRLDRTTGCSSLSADPTTLSVPGSPIAGGADLPPGHSVLVAEHGGSDAARTGASATDRSGSPGTTGGVLGESSERTPPAAVVRGAGTDLAVPLMLVALMLAAMAALVTARREQQD